MCLHGEKRVVGLPPSVGTQLIVQQKRQLLELLSDFKSVISGRYGRTSICQLRKDYQYNSGHTVCHMHTKTQLRGSEK